MQAKQNKTKQIQKQKQTNTKQSQKEEEELYSNLTKKNQSTRFGYQVKKALIQCYFNYSCLSWYCSLGNGMIEKLQVV